MTNERTITIKEEYLETVERKVEALKALIEVSALISSTLDFNDLMCLVMEKAKGFMGAEACSILLYNKESKHLEFDLALCQEESMSDILKRKIVLELGQGIAGWVAEHQTPLIIKDAKSDSRFYAEADRLTRFTTRSLIAVPLVGKRGLIGVAEILNPKQKEFFDGEDLEIFQTLCRQVAIAIENAQFHRESMEEERLRQELEIAAALQRSFLPESSAFKKGPLAVSAVNFPAARIGGDLYDFIELDRQRMGVFIGDVSGKGISAAIFMAKVISDFRNIALQGETPVVALNRLNAMLSGVPRGMFLSGIYGVVDLSTGDVSLSSAGHPPFLWLTGGGVKVMDVSSGPPLGIVPMEYHSTSVSLQKGDKLLFLTDGAFDAKNRKGERIGFERLTECVKKQIREENLVQRLTDFIGEFSEGLARADDLTIVELRWEGA